MGAVATKDPERDENGRLIDPECFDINPATWHLAAVNQIGRAKRSFILDATYDYEVWNQPVYAYEYFYFNPETKKTTKTIAEAAVTPENFKSDPFKKYRGPQIEKIVGVAMRVGYIVELGAGPREEEGQDWDQIHWVEYLYDLEIDPSGEISGGNGILRCIRISSGGRHQMLGPIHRWISTSMRRHGILTGHCLSCGGRFLLKSRPMGTSQRSSWRSWSVCPVKICQKTIMTELGLNRHSEKRSLVLLIWLSQGCRLEQRTLVERILT